MACKRSTWIAEKTSVPRVECMARAAGIVARPGWIEYQWQWRSVANAEVLLQVLVLNGPLRWCSLK